ncbi:hypothetical protein BRX37_16650 [Sphingomonas sp. S-NIH.Pt3_0716]|nr:hypothetical protein BRX37_16650 [Sphingomonas sp. S-NIH.Pt3_0716]
MMRFDPAAPRAPRSAYDVRGKYAARRSFDVPAELLTPRAPEPQLPLEMPRWFSAAGFAMISTAMLFCMCAIGRAGA